MGQRMSLVYQLTCPQTVLHAKWALLHVWFEPELTSYGGTNKPIKTPRRNAILFLAVVASLRDERRNDRTSTIHITEPLLFPTTDTEVTFTAKMSYKIAILNKKPAKGKHTAESLHDTEAVINSIWSALMPLE